MNVRRVLGVLTLLGAVLGCWLGITSGLSRAAEGSQVEHLTDPRGLVELLRSDESGIEFVVDITDFEVVREVIDGAEYHIVVVPDLESSAKAGSPQIPGRRVLLGIPLGVDYDLRVSVLESENIPGQYRLLPAPTPIFDLDPASGFDPGVPAPGASDWEYVEDERAYSVAAFQPKTIARIASSGFIRDQRYVAVQVNPVQYNPASGELVLHRRFRVLIEFSYPRDLEMSVSQSTGSFEPVLAASLLNYESAANWRGRVPYPVVSASVQEKAKNADAGTPAYKVLVNETGIYQVTAGDLAALGLDVAGIPTTTYKLSYRGREVPIRILASGDGPLESLWFYGEQAQTKYTDTNVYWLTYDPVPLPGAEPGLRMPLKSAPPVPTSTAEISLDYSTTVRLEEDLLYRPQMPWAEGLDVDPWDHWFWDFTRRYDDPDNPYNKPVLVFPAQISGLSTEPYTATLAASMSSLTQDLSVTPDHCVDFYLNGDWVDRHTWDGMHSEELVTFHFTGTLLLEGGNSVEVHTCETGAFSDRAYYDWFELDVRRSYQAEGDSLVFDVAEAGWQYRIEGLSTNTVEVFDVSGTYTVSHLVGVEVTGSSPQYTAAFYDQTAYVGTRYLALTHDQLKSPLSIVKDTPSNLVDPANQADYIVIAPKEFMTAVQPLVGHRAAQGLVVQTADLESVFDEFNYGIYSPEAIRDFLSYAYHSWSGEPPAYVLLVGDGTYDYKGKLGDGNPNLLPPYLAFVDPEMGETAADNRYVTVSGDDPLPDLHIGRFSAETAAQVSAMVAKTIAYETSPTPGDWTERVLFVTDNDWRYYYFSDVLVNGYLPEPYSPIKVYQGLTCPTENPSVVCKQEILATLNTTGALLVNYIGHGAPNQWAGEKLWTIEDLSQLEPTERYPVILAMTCREGSFHEATVDALGESVVRLADRGAVASWSATGYGYATGHDYLNRGFFQAALFDGVRELGAAADVGKSWLFATGYYTDLLETYHLFGDPALRLNSLDVVDVAVGQVIDAPPVPAPGDVVTFTLGFTNAGPDVATGVVLTDLLSSVFVTPTVVFSSSEVLVQREGITFAWTIDDLLPAASGKIVLTATVDPLWPEPDASFFNEARIGVQTHDLVPHNNVTLLGVNLKSVYLPLVMKGY